MTKTNKKTLEEIIRVDHAGERGAIKIYEGQLLALKTFKQNEYLKKTIEEMKEHENEHYDFFNNEIKLKEKIIKFRDDELSHRDIAYEGGASKEGPYGLLDKIIKTSSRIAIKISEKI